MSLQAIINEAFEKELDLLIDELEAKHIDLGQKASGRWVESLRQEIKGAKGAIFAEAYTEQLVKGREPGKRPPISPLEDWAKVKLGLSGKEALNAAFAIATKIGKEGTNIYKDGGTDLLESVFTPQRIKQMYDNIGKVIFAEVNKDLLRTVKA